MAGRGTHPLNCSWAIVDLLLKRKFRIKKSTDLCGQRGFLDHLRALTLSDHASDVPTVKCTNSDQRLDATATKSRKIVEELLPSFEMSKKERKTAGFFTV